MKKVVALLGSPRKNGNSSRLAKTILDQFDSNENEIHTIHLSDSHIAPCRGCFYCRKSEQCVIHDDMSHIVETVKNADIVIISSPVYFIQITGQVKQMMDRLYPLLLGEPGKYHLGYNPKDTVVIYSQGHPIDTAQADYFLHVKNALGMLGLHVVDSLVCVSANDPGSLEQQPELIQRAVSLGKQLSGHH